MTERPGFLSIGIALTAAHAALICLLSVLGGLAVVFASGFGALSLPPPDAFLPLGVALGVGLVVAGLALLFYSAVILVCIKAWGGSRPWLWALVVLAGIGLVNTGPISAVINVMTIVGAMQWLERNPREERPTMAEA